MVLTVAYLILFLFTSSEFVYFVTISTPVYLVASYLFYYRAFDSIQDKTLISIMTN